MNIYDFDKTLFAGDSTAAFLKYSMRKHPGLIRFLPGMGLAAAEHYLLKRTTKTQMKQRFYRIFTGYDAQALLEEFWDRHQHKVFPWYASQQEETDIVISASPEFLHPASHCLPCRSQNRHLYRRKLLGPGEGCAAPGGAGIHPV